MTCLAVDHLTAAYGEVQVLGGISITVDKGEAAALFGANGSGKSTLLRAINGLIPHRGEVRINGKSIYRLTAEMIAAQGVAHVPQGRGTFMSFTVDENLRLGGSTLHNRDVRIELDRVFTLLPELADRRGQIAGMLSGGEQQMLAVGRALMMRPKLMLLDEPSFGLAPKIVVRLFDALNRLRDATGLSFLLVEQNPELCAHFADSAHLLEGGRIAMSTSPDDPELRDRLKRSHMALT